jgi:hypothetical protein
LRDSSVLKNLLEANLWQTSGEREVVVVRCRRKQLVWDRLSPSSG